tara:strand:- start:941 stop:1870 length:930 start_codon:yes stop_codon:yes gene_type:complete
MTALASHSSATPRVSFSVNVCNSDAQYIEHTIPHMLNVLNYDFIERRVAYDPGPLEGKYAKRNEGNAKAISQVLSHLQSANIIDCVDTVPWTSHCQTKVMQKYFGAQNKTPKDFSGAPVYQYLYALYQCSGDYVFHADADMLFHSPAGSSWIAQGVELLASHPHIIASCPHAGPPKANTVKEWLFNKPASSHSPRQWKQVHFTSTRSFLLDIKKFENCLPLQQNTPNEPLENTLTACFKNNGYQHWNWAGYEHWALHPVSHGNNFLSYLPHIITTIEQGLYPFRRRGNSWDIYTEDKRFKPWLKLLNTL